MNKKVITIIIVAVLVLAAGSYYMITSTESSSANDMAEKQLYTCGMHPDIISEEPGNCPICDMKLTPIKKSNSSSSGEKKILFWRAPMNPNEIYDAPGKSQMGMDLVPVYEDGDGASGVVTVDGSVQQSMNVKIGVVKAKNLTTKITTNAIVSTDERNEYMVNTKVNGWIENLYVNYTGQKVKKGQKLVDIYSPELVAAQQELLTAITYKTATENSSDSDILESGSELINNTIKKLELLDISGADIERLMKTKEIKKYMTLYAPMDGTVLMKYVIDGEKIAAGKNLLHIADLSYLWIKADIYENELNKIELGSTAEITFSYKPGAIYKGKVTFIYPTVDPKTRIIQLRIDVPNPNGELKPAMFANVEIKGKELSLLPAVSETSILRSGKKAIIIQSLGEGKFKPVEVKLGEYSDGYYQVIDGIKEGDKIVESAQFMIDSESSLRAAVNLFSESKPGTPEMDMTNEEEMIENVKTEMEGNDHSHAEHQNDIVRTGTIALDSIDANRDGKVFQDFMDWNVISDKEGRCPICEMKLQEVTLEKAKENLLMNGFKVK